MTKEAIGPLRVHTTNPRYFTDSNGKIVYLTGSHHWNNFQDSELLEKFDYTAYLNFLEKCNHNFMRLWVWEGSASVRGEQLNFIYDPLPYLRIGPKWLLMAN